MNIRVHVKIYGAVQGVFFRENTVQKAKELRIKGFVRNLADGSVEAVFEGHENKVKEMIEWCKKGPPLAKVDNLKLEFSKYKKGEFESFERR